VPKKRSPGEERRERGTGAKFQRLHAASCGPRGVNCKRPPDAPAHGLWVARLELPAHGGGRRRKEITAATEDGLNRKLSEFRRQFALYGDLPTASEPVSKWMTYWLDEIAVNRVRPNTLAGYRSVSKLIVEAIGNIRLENLQPAHVRKVHEHITGSGKTSTYALNAHRVLSRALKDAEAEGLINRNPAALIDAPRKSRTKLNALTTDEAIALIRRSIPELEGLTEVYDPEPARWATYLLTGMRRGELLGLEWDRVDLDHEAGIVDLSWQLLRVTDISKAPADYEYRPIRGSMYWTRPKSNAGWRMIPLVEPLRSILQAHRERAGANSWGLVFTTPQGDPIDPDAETARWREVSRGVTDLEVRLHDLRHTTVDLLLDAGVPEDVVMEIIGHSTRATTRGYKSKVKYTRRTEAMKQLSESLGLG
jgi:integrase